ncbi:MAG: glycosyltransferase [Nitrospiraceae bacterium]
MFDNEFPPLGGGTGVVNEHLLREMAKRQDLTVDLVTSSRSPRTYELEQFADRITLHKVPVDNRNIHHATNAELLRYSRRGLRLAYRLVKQYRYDLTFAFAGVPAGAMSYALHLTHRLPYLVSLQGPDVPGFEARYDYLYPVLRPIIRRIWRSAAVVTAISGEQVELAHRTMPELRAITVPNGVDTERFCPRAKAPSEVVTLVCAARLIERKGQHYLLRAVARLCEASARRVKVTLVGTGDAEPMLRELAERLGLADDVTFRGFVPRAAMPAEYHAADIFVLPSQHEGMSIALLEAMASGLPVVVTDTGGTAELVTDGENGKIVPWGDESALTDALASLVDANRYAPAHGGGRAPCGAVRLAWRLRPGMWTFACRWHRAPGCRRGIDDRRIARDG